MLIEAYIHNYYAQPNLQRDLRSWKLFVGSGTRSFLRNELIKYSVYVIRQGVRVAPHGTVLRIGAARGCHRQDVCGARESLQKMYE